MEFSKPNIFYKPLEVEIQNVIAAANDSVPATEVEDINEVAEKLMDHLALIEDYNNRIESVDWLIENAKKMAGNLRYSTQDPQILGAINDLGGDGGYVDMKLFEKAVDIVIEGYKQQALISLTGAAN